MKQIVIFADQSRPRVKEAVAEYVRRHSPLAPRIEGRFLRDDDRAVSADLADALPRYKPLEDLTH